MQKIIGIIVFSILTTFCSGEVRIIATSPKGSAKPNEEVEITFYVTNTGKKKGKFPSVDQWYPNIEFVSFEGEYSFIDVFVTDYEAMKNKKIKPGERIEIKRTMKMPDGEGIALIGLYQIETTKCPIRIEKK